MNTFFTTYFAWASPNIIPAIASAAAAAWLVGWMRGYGPIPPSAMNIIMPIGLATILVLALSVGAAVLGIEPPAAAELFGIIAGSFAGVLLAPNRP
jgi:hypothetical protein